MTQREGFLALDVKREASREEIPSPEAIASLTRNAKTLQLASSLLGAVAGLPAPVVLMFASASANVSVNEAVIQTAMAMQRIKNGRVLAVLPEGQIGEGSGWTSGHMPAEFEVPGWKIARRDGVYTAVSNPALAAGSVLPASLFETLLKAAHDHVDIVLLAGGCIPTSPQALLLAPYCTGVALLALPDVTTAQDLKRSQKILTQVRAQILGCAFVETTPY